MVKSALKIGFVRLRATTEISSEISRREFVERGFSLASFDWQPLFLSFKVAGAALLPTFVLATWAAHALAKARFRGRDIVDALLLLPLVLPPVVTGYVLLLLFGINGWPGAWLHRVLDVTLLFTPAAAVAASSVVAFPLMYQSAKAAFIGVDAMFLDAARSLGAGRARVFWTVTLPLSRAGLLAGAILSFARALGEFGATIMVAGNIEGKTVTAPNAIYNAVENGDFRNAGIYALAVALFNLIFVVFLNTWLRWTHQKPSQIR